MSGDQHRARSVGHIDGVPVFWDDRSGDATTTVELLFRVGLHDERLPSTGLTELVLRLALDRFPDDQPQLLSGSVDGLVTRCSVGGQPDEVAATVRQLCAELSAPSSGSLTRVREELLDAHAVRPHDAELQLLALRYGPSGPGLHAWGAIGVHGADDAAVDAWAAARFVRANMVVRGAGPRPSGLDLPLRQGRWSPPPPSPTERIPARTMEVEAGEVAVSGVVPLGPALADALDVLRRAVGQRLEAEHGWRVHLLPHIRPLTADRAHLTVTLTIDPERSVPALRTLLQVLDEQATRTPEADPAGRSLPSAALNPWQTAVQDLLHGPGSLAATLQPATTPEDVRECLAALQESVVVLAPHAEPEDLPGMTPYVQSPPPSITDGQRFRVLGSGGRTRSLLVGADGVASEEGRRITTAMRFRELVAVLAWTDGRRQLVDVDGASLVIPPEEIEHGFAAVQRIDRAIAPQLVVPIDHPARRPLGDPPLVRRTPDLPAGRATARTSAERRTQRRRRE